MFRVILAAALALTATLAIAPFGAAQQPTSSEPLSPGAANLRVPTLRNPQQSYALYLPSKYSRDRDWPIVYVFDPLARGALALQQFQHAAELHGYIVAASNNSRNGPWAPEAEAADAMLRDTQQRFAVDRNRIYFAGFSGGARVSAQLAQLCKCAAGVLLSGAGFSESSPPSPAAKFAVFSAVGNADFNYSEVIPLQDTLEKGTFPRWLRTFAGRHEWSPPEAIDEALAWFRIQSMKSQVAPREEAFVQAQFSIAHDRATSLEKSGDLLAAWREYRQIIATFAGLTDVSALHNTAVALEKQKPLREAGKRERSDFDDQQRLSGEILAAASAQRPRDPAQTESTAGASALTKDLRQRAERDKNPDRTLVFKRALAGVFIGSIESGSDALDKKDYNRAAQLFACATEANPDSEWAFRNLAIAHALSGDKKGALEALRSARKLTKDPQDFSDWLKQEPGLSTIRSVKEFQALTD